jgi:DNA repair protein RecN (Recombination protein N)
MLAELRIENLVLIERVHLELCSGFNAFTGETGAGKSLLVDALNLLFGARGDADLVRPGAEAAEVSARFLLSDPEIVHALKENLGVAFEEPEGKRGAHVWELVVSRQLPRSGRARAHANGRPLALPALKSLGEHLLDIHGQHENQSLLRPAARLEILDRFAEAWDAREAVRTAHARAGETARALAEVRRAARERTGREELLRFQLRELDDAQLEGLDPEALEGELKLLRGGARIRDAFAQAAELLDGEDSASAAGLCARGLKGLETLGDVGPGAAKLVQRLDSLLAEARDLAAELTGLAEKARSDPERLTELEERRARLKSLERKYARDLAGLRAFHEQLQRDAEGLQNVETRTRACEGALEAACLDLKAAAAKLTRMRRAAARELEKAVAVELAELGLKGAALKVALEPHAKAAVPAAPEDVESEAARLVPAEFHATGAEYAELLFSANPDLPPKPLAECASGGELSRVMLALKGILARHNGADRLPVVVFDEVDQGVGGRMGAVLGLKLAALAKIRQVLIVTHQPQIAVYAEAQFTVEKRRVGEHTQVGAKLLDETGRVAELAQMLRGAAASEHTRAEAKEMLRAARADLKPAKPGKVKG